MADEGSPSIDTHEGEDALGLASLADSTTALGAYLQAQRKHDAEERAREWARPEDWRADELTHSALLLSDFFAAVTPYVVGAAAQGIIGNVSHDLILRSLSKVRGFMPGKGEPTVAEVNQMLDSYAIAAVLARAEDQAIPVPAEEDLRVKWAPSRSQKWMIRGTVSSVSDESFQANVEMDPLQTGRTGVQVRIRSTTD